MSETCQKCGAVGEDRRTLWMACFYAMDELGVPFEQVEIRGTMHRHEGETRKPMFEGGPEWKIDTFKDQPEEGGTQHRRFFRLRVCKECRSSWMLAIKSWFYSAQPEIIDSPGTGIYIRERGVCREVSYAEWEAYSAKKGKK